MDNETSRVPLREAPSGYDQPAWGLVSSVPHDRHCILGYIAHINPTPCVPTVRPASPKLVAHSPPDVAVTEGPKLWLQWHPYCPSTCPAASIPVHPRGVFRIPPKETPCHSRLYADSGSLISSAHWHTMRTYPILCSFASCLTSEDHSESPK